MKVTKGERTRLRADVKGARNADVVNLLDSLDEMERDYDKMMNQARDETAYWQRACNEACLETMVAENAHRTSRTHGGCHEDLLAERARAAEFEDKMNLALDMYADACKACTGVVSRTGPDKNRDNILTQRPLAEMVRGLARERNQAQEQAAYWQRECAKQDKTATRGRAAEFEARGGGMTTPCRFCDLASRGTHRHLCPQTEIDQLEAQLEHHTASWKKNEEAWIEQEIALKAKVERLTMALRGVMPFVDAHPVSIVVENMNAALADVEADEAVKG